MSWLTEQQRQFLWGALEQYLEDEAWSEMLEEEDGIPFDPAVVKSTWVKLDRFDQYGPIGLAFTEQEQALLWGLMSSYVGTLECSEACTEQNPCPTDDDCISYHDLAVAIHQGASVDDGLDQEILGVDVQSVVDLALRGDYGELSTPIAVEYGTAESILDQASVLLGQHLRGAHDAARAYTFDVFGPDVLRK